MNVENIKSELQQVLDSDVALRKEYNVVKRSLSDYRNQLIERDEDCKRLQVSIDVLNTKLLVMERDNVHLKSEVSSFKELRNTIREQLQEKQLEIDGLLSKIDELTQQLSTISSDYELQISDLQAESNEEIKSLRAAYDFQIDELKTGSTYQQSGIRTELESKMTELSKNYESTYSETVSSYETKIENLNADYQAQLNSLKSESENRIALLSNTSNDSISALTNEYELKIDGLTYQWNAEKTELVSGYEERLSTLSSTFTTEKEILTESFESQINELNTLLETKQSDFEAELNSTVQSLTESFTNKEQELTSTFDSKLGSVQNESLELSSTLAANYEEKLANTVIHSTSQNSKLCDDISALTLENDTLKLTIGELNEHSTSQTFQIGLLSEEVISKTSEVASNNERYQTLVSEFESYKNLQLSSIDDQIISLNEKISELESSISLKDLTIAELAISVEEQTSLFTNLTDAHSSLQEQYSNLNSTFETEKTNFDNFINELSSGHTLTLESKDVEFNKLLTENTSLICEIDSIADKLEETELQLQQVNSELSELKIVADGRAEELKETLNGKNFEITTLTANNSALSTELTLLKIEVENLRSDIQISENSSEEAAKRISEFNEMSVRNEELNQQLISYQATITGLNVEITNLSSRIAVNETEILNLKSESKADEQDAFIDRLFKQIDVLSDDRLSLLNEKEEMANQLLKMTETVSNISQHVDSQNIDVTALDNHRKNVILANGSGNNGSDKTVMKKQINELVREIDKCIALLSA